MSKNPKPLTLGKKTKLCAGDVPWRVHQPTFATTKVLKKTEKHLMNLAQYQSLMLKCTYYFSHTNTILT